MPSNIHGRGHFARLGIAPAALDWLVECDDLATLQRWLAQAVTAISAAEALQ